MASPTEPSSEDFKEVSRRPSKNFIEDVLYTAKKSESVNFHRHDDIPPSGAAILLANPHRLSKAELQTPQQDFNLMEQALQGLNFITVAKLLDDITEKRQVKEIITQTSRLDLARYASFLFYYSGHADESGLVLPDSHMIEYSFVIESVCKCKSLQGKPKIFIFDCSRSPVRGGRVHAEPLTEENIPGDCVVVFSTRHKGLAFGDPDKGSFFTSILAESLRHTLTSADEEVDFMDVLAEVNQDVANFVPRRSNGHYTQSPQLVSTLRTGMKLEVTKTGLVCKVEEGMSQTSSTWPCQLM